MISKKVVQQIRELELTTKRIAKGMLMGASKSRYKGFGFEFDQLRAYQYGDDIRLIDWKSSARTNDNKLLVRQYFEERNRTFIICLDVSASTYFGTEPMSKQDMMQHVSGVLALVTEYSNDRVGLVLFSNTIEKVIPPHKGKAHVRMILDTIFSHKPLHKETDFSVVSDYIIRNIKKHAVVFLISDFIGKTVTASMLKKMTVGYEVIALSCYDAREQEIPPVGFVWMRDSETQQLALIDARKHKASFTAKALKNRLMEQKELFFAHKIDFLEMRTTENFVHDLLLFFQKRLLY